MNKLMIKIVAGILAVGLTGVAYAGPKYVCWNGTVVKNPKQCPPYKLPVVCPDGSVVSDPAKCPPVVLCPDGSLSASISSCPVIPPPDTDPAVVTQ